MRTINISSPHNNAWLRQFPDGLPVWGDWRFTFNDELNKHDYLVAFDDLHGLVPKANTVKGAIHIATEPPMVHHYDDDFLRQFSWIISQDRDCKHPGLILGQPGLTWFVGWVPGEVQSDSTLTFKQLESLFDKPKSKLLSVIASNKSFTLGHEKRLKFALALKDHYGENIDFYGRGFSPMVDKLDALLDYRFNIVLENSIFDDYFSEKLTDCFISGSFPLYSGCPNLENYFPKEAFVKLDIDDFDGSVKCIDEAINKDFDRVKRQDLLAARDLSMRVHNLFPMLINTISDIEKGLHGASPAPTVRGDMWMPFRSNDTTKKVGLYSRMKGVAGKLMDGVFRR